MARPGFYVKADISDAVFKCLSKMDSYDKATSDRLQSIVIDGTKNVMNRAMNNVPVKTGKLRSTIRMDITENRKNRVTGIVYTKCPYAHLVENGAGPIPALVPVKKKAMHPGGTGDYFKIASIPARKAHPFMKPAMDAERPIIERKLREALNEN